MRPAAPAVGGQRRGVKADGGRNTAHHLQPAALRWPGFALLYHWRLGAAARQPAVAHWGRMALLGLLGMGNYNALQYMALKASTRST